MKPNFVADDPGIGEHSGRFMLFVGRLSEEKVVTHLFEAWDRHPRPSVRIGVLGSLVRDGISGVSVDPGDAREIANKVLWCQAHPPEIIQMGVHTRVEYELHYSASGNYAALLEDYQAALRRRGDGSWV